MTYRNLGVERLQIASNNCGHVPIGSWISEVLPLYRVPVVQSRLEIAGSFWYLALCSGTWLMRNNPREILLNLHREHVKAWQQKSLGNLHRLYADDVVVFNTVPPPRFSDFKTFENTLQQYFAQIQELTLFTENIQIEVEGDVGWITSQYLMAYQSKDQFLRQTGRWTEIYQRNEGEWKLAHLHSSSDPVE